MGQPRVRWIAHGGSSLRCSPDQIRPSAGAIGQAERPDNQQHAEAALQGLRRGGVVQFLDISQFPGPTEDDLSLPMD
eukprot:1520624-Pyramimonas_sp.AAC.1